MADCNLKTDHILTQGPKYGKPVKPVPLKEPLEIYETLLPCAQKVVDLRLKELGSSQKIEPGEF